MKIGIITCGLEPNYGACLQALALQYILEKIGAESVIVNYTFQPRKGYLPWTHNSVKSFVSYSLYFNLRYGLYKSFDAFRKRQMSYTAKEYNSVNDFKNCVDEFDCYLVGSDQVWNPYLGIDLDITLLDFFDAKNGPIKASYASSFGIDKLPMEYKEKYSKALPEFEYIAVRENSGKEIIESLIGKTPKVLLDPTLLLNKSEWQFFSEETYLRNEKYILIYDMNHSDGMISKAISLAKDRNCKIVALSKVIIPNTKIRTLHNINPGHFLNLINNANYVLTDSYHGTLFSIIYHKEFLVFCSKKSEKICGRITDVLTKLGLEDRLVYSGNDTTPHKISYDIVDNIINKLRAESTDYLKRIIENE